MTNLIVGSAFKSALRSRGEDLADRNLRLLVFRYCELYQKVYWFDQLENVFVFLELALAGDDPDLQSELPEIRVEVEDAMGEYFESLNEVATALHRLLDPRPITTDDALDAISHVWKAHACNEDPEDFRSREDGILCELLASASQSQ